MKTSIKILIATLACNLGIAHAQIAADNAGNYSGWGHSDNGGFGFLPWAISSNDGGGNFAGTFIGDSTFGAGDINTGGQSFGLYANPGSAFVNADRGFASPLSLGEVFTFDMALNFDNGSKGFVLFAGTQGEVFNFNVGGGGGVSSNNATLNPGAGAGYDYGGNDAVLNLSFGYVSDEVVSYSISRSSESGNQGVLFSGTVSNLFDAPSGFRFYNSGTDNGLDQNNLYFNNLQVIPEPGTLLLLVGGLGAIAAYRRKMRA
ncbi:MAG: PEP-CTERM sorting domain-containing protein [Verrucomicrobia bacterium]|nr:PEP-CTERM sorting domain-containing protein [Verrucomicrobiota bacterium]MCH8514603.1 PEP-CTERM sorting domain-containing protein [Kiritimatiellia bacterium]